MAETFQTALNNDNGAIPIIFSKKLALCYTNQRGQAVIDNLTNENYAGEIKNAGDRVRIVLPQKPNLDLIYTGDKAEVCPTFQTVAPESLDLVINKKATFGLAIDDVQKTQTQFKTWLDGQASAYAEAMKDKRNIEIAQYIFDYTVTDNPASGADQGSIYEADNHAFAGSYGTLATPYNARVIDSSNIFTFLLEIKQKLIESGAIGADGTYSFKPMEEEARDDRAVLVVTPAMHTLIMSSYRVGGRSVEMADVIVKDGAVSRVAGMDVVIDKTLGKLTYTSGSSAVPTSGMPFLAGTKNAVTRAEQINKVESVRDPYCFRDLVKAISLYGFKMLHPEALVRGVLPVVAPTESVPVKVTNPTSEPIPTKPQTT